jgi:hypothetical protein
VHTVRTVPSEWRALAEAHGAIKDFRITLKRTAWQGTCAAWGGGDVHKRQRRRDSYAKRRWQHNLLKGYSWVISSGLGTSP